MHVQTQAGPSQGAPHKLFELKKLVQTQAEPPQDAPHQLFELKKLVCEPG